MTGRDRGIRPGVRRLFRLAPRTVDQAHADADAELEAFLEERVEQLVRRGMSADAARAEALARLGPEMDLTRSALRQSAVRREQRRRFAERVGAMGDDLRFAWRQYRRAPGFALVAVLTLAFSIGANTAIFSVVHRLLLAPLPYPGAERLVMPMWDGERRGWIGPELVHAWQARTRTVSAIASASEFIFSVHRDTVDTLPGAAMTANLLPILGVQPVLGRGFRAVEERSDGQPSVAMVSHALWRRAYGGRADVVGSTVSYEGRPLVIVGVTPPGFSIPLWQAPAPDIWVPATLETAAEAGNGIMRVGPSIFAVLRPGSSADAVTRELEATAAELPEGERGAASPEGQRRLRALRAQDFLKPAERRALQVLFAAVGALLLIACANLANLLLARASARRREFAVRGALGAGRARIARQVLTESLALAMGGGALGVAVAWLALRVIVALRPPALEQLADVRLDPMVLLWCLAVSVTTGIVFGSVPALLSSAQQSGDVLRRETRGGTSGTMARRLRSGLIVLEVSASLVLLVGAGLLVRSFVALQQMPLGFEPRGLVYADVLMLGRQLRDRRVAIRNEIVARLKALPGVTGVAIGSMPGRSFGNTDGLTAETDTAGHTVRVPTLGTVYITPDYFRVARIALLQGRLPDTASAWMAQGRPFDLSPEVLVNRELARRVWPRGRAIGARVQMARDATGASGADWSTIVGVVDDTQMPDVRGDAAGLQVFSLIRPQVGDVPFVVRTTMSGDASAPLVKRTMASVHPGIWVRPTLSGDTYLRDGLAPTRFAMALLTAFAALALLIATVGLYGVVAYGVGQRTREFGVRVALGAEPRSLVRLVVGEGMRLAAIGVAIGAAVAVASTRLLRTMLHDVSAADPFTFAAVAVLVAAVAVVASYVPARRALRIDPTESLRAD